MPRKEQEIWQACDDLLVMGKSPREITGEAIGNRLRELGLKPGSLTYRYRYRDSWMEKRRLTRENLEHIDAKPSDIIERSAAIFKKAIEESVREEYETKYQEAKNEVEEFRQRYETCYQTLEATTNVKEELTLKLTLAQEEMATLKQKLIEEREKQIQIEGRLEATLQRLKEQQAEQEISQHKNAELQAHLLSSREKIGRLEERLNIAIIEISYLKEGKVCA